MNISMSGNITMVDRCFEAAMHKADVEHDMVKTHLLDSFRVLSMMFDLCLVPQFKQRSRWSFTQDVVNEETGELGAALSKHYTNTTIKSIAANEIGDDIVTIGIDIDKCMIELYIGQCGIYQIKLVNDSIYEVTSNEYDKNNELYIILTQTVENVCKRHKEFVERAKHEMPKMMDEFYKDDDEE